MAGGFGQIFIEFYWQIAKLKFFEFLFFKSCFLPFCNCFLRKCGRRLWPNFYRIFFDNLKFQKISNCQKNCQNCNCFLRIGGRRLWPNFYRILLTNAKLKFFEFLFFKSCFLPFCNCFLRKGGRRLWPNFYRIFFDNLKFQIVKKIVKIATVFWE